MEGCLGEEFLNSITFVRSSLVVAGDDSASIGVAGVASGDGDGADARLDRSGGGSGVGDVHGGDGTGGNE